MRFPDFMKKEDCIGFVAPAFGCATEPYHTAFKNALKNSLCSINDRVSKLNVEKVVSPPKSPAVRKDFKFAFDNT